MRDRVEVSLLIGVGAFAATMVGYMIWKVFVMYGPWLAALMIGIGVAGTTFILESATSR